MNSLTEIWFEIHSALFEFVFLLKLKRHKCLSGGREMKTKMCGLAIWKSKKMFAFATYILNLSTTLFIQFTPPSILSVRIKTDWCILESKFAKLEVYVLPQHLRSLNCTIKQFSLQTHVPSYLSYQDFRYSTLDRKTNSRQPTSWVQTKFVILT